MCHCGSTAHSSPAVWCSRRLPARFSAGFLQSSPTMSDAASLRGNAVSLVGVSKTYRLYRKPLYRFLDLFGACPQMPAYFSEHQALADINITVRRGEKVAIIGRNGAGKSTLLKIITGLVKPSTGSAAV